MSSSDNPPQEGEASEHLSPIAERQVEALVEDFLGLLQCGHKPSRPDLVAEHPHLAPVLDRRLALVEMMFRAGQAVAAATPGDAETLPPTPAALSTPSPGLGTVRYFGDYQLLEEIARGGMGVVYRARQVSLNRPVALKMILAGELASSADVHRFRQEAEAAAQLEHPHILPIYEVGEHEGQHYFSMKLVNGGNLASFSREPAASVAGQRRAAQLLAQVARAVHYAHQRGVLHRDLKPANVLLDEDGQPYVTDFGLAKRVESEPGASATGAAITQSGAILGTPGYMAPEQARAEKGLSVAADVFSLGAILYELLTGQPAFQGATPLDRVLAVLNEEPRPPRSLAPAPPRDLETICLKCLQKDPSGRYSSALALADDLDCWLAGEPIQARPVGQAERLWRWCRRNPLVAGLTAALFAVVVAGLIGLTALWLHAEDRRRDAETAEEQMRRQKERADQNLIEAETAKEQMRRQKERATHNLAKAREAVEQYLRKTAMHPRLRAGDFADLRKELLATAVPFFEEFVVQTKDDPALEADRGRAYGELAFARLEMGQHEQALADYQQSLAIYAGLAGRFPDEPSHRANVAVSQDALGLLLDGMGKHDQAEAAYLEARRLREQLIKEFSDRPVYRYELATTLQHLASLLTSLGKTRRADADAAQVEALRLVRELVAQFPDNVSYKSLLAGNVGNRGNRLAEQGKGAEALVAYREARALFEQLAQEFPTEAQYQDDLALHLMMAGNLHRQLDNPVEAEAAYRRAVEVAEKLQEQHSNIPLYRHRLAGCWNGLAVILSETGKHAAAEKAYAQALAIDEKLAATFPGVPAYKVSLAHGYTNWANVLQALGQRIKSRSALEKALAICHQLAREFPAVPEYRVQLAGICVNLASLTQDDQPAEALTWCDKAIAAAAPVVAQDPQGVHGRECLSKASFRRAWNLTKLGRHAEALKDWDRALDQDIGQLPDRIRLQRALTLARLKEHRRAVAEAKPIADKKDVPPYLLCDAAGVYAISSAAVANDPKLQETYAARAVELLRTAIALGLTNADQSLQNPDLDPLRARADFQKLARTPIEQCTEMIRAHPDRPLPYMTRGVHYARLGQLDKAIADYTQALKLDPKLAMAYRNRGRDYSTLGEHDRAIADFTKSLEIEPGNAFALCDRGHNYLRKGMYDEAIADCTLAIKADPHLALAYYHRGDAHLKKKNWDPAIADFAKVIDFEPGNALAVYQRGYAYSQKGDYDKSIAAFTEAICLNPKAAVFYLNRGMDYADKGLHAKAAADYTEAIKLEPGNAMAYGLRETAHRALGDKVKAAEDRRKVEELNINAKAAETWNRGIAHSEKGEYAQAIPHFDEAIRLVPTVAQAYYNRGHAYSNLGKHDLALADYSEAIRLNPKDALAHFGRAFNYFNKNELDKAIADYTAAIRLDPKMADAYLYRGGLYDMQGKQPQALADFAEVIRLDPKNPYGYTSRAFTYLYQKEYDKALADSNHALKLDPTNVTAFCHRGFAYAGKKEYDKAMADYLKAERLDPKAPDSYGLRAWLWATCPDAKIRNGKKALEYARKACELTSWKNPNQWDTLAAAYAELGNFAEAVKWLSKALASPEFVPQERVLAQARLKLYQQGKPYRNE
jgi:tetratricopeptide (TPR) repeat protein